MGAINIPWIQFFDSKMQVRPEMKERLQQVGITSDKKIYVIDDQGVRSAAVVLALRELGYARSANFAGGYMQLMSK